MELNEKLAMLRKNNGYSTRELGEKLRVSQSSVSLWEKGARRPDMGTLVKIANLYGVSTDYLLGSEDNSVKSELTILNEQLNSLERNMTMIKKEMDNIQKEIGLYLNTIICDERYLGEIINNSYIKSDDELDHKLKKYISERIANNKQKVQELDKMMIDKQKEFDKNNTFLKETHSKIRTSEYKEHHIKNNLRKIERKSFNNIHIESENELQILILKYLGIYDTFKNTNLSTDKIMEKVKKLIYENIWDI